MSDYWLLIAVLQSTLPLDQAVALRLYHAAVELEATDGSVQQLQGDIAQGKVRRLRKNMLIGTIGGPAFEAEIDTPRGASMVRFVVTPEGLARANPSTPNTMVN